MKKWKELKKREKILVGGCVALLGVYLLGSLGSHDDKNNKEVSSPIEISKQTNAPTQTSQSVDYENLSGKEKIEQFISEGLKGQNNNHKDYLRNLDVTEDNGKYSVIVEFNASDNLTTHLRKVGIEKKMSQIYEILYSSNLSVETANISAFFPMQDKYGNVSDQAIYKTSLSAEEAQKINWNSDKSTLQLQIVPNVWTTIYLLPELK